MAKGKKAAFGGYSINFKGCKDSAEAIFGGSPIGPSEMTKKIWAYVKRKKLGGIKHVPRGFGLLGRVACGEPRFVFPARSQRGVLYGASLLRSGRMPSSSSGAPVRLHQATW